MEYCRVRVYPDLLIKCSGAAAGLLTQRGDTGYCLMINCAHLAIIICSANLVRKGSLLFVHLVDLYRDYICGPKCSVTIYNNDKET